MYYITFIRLDLNKRKLQHVPHNLTFWQKPYFPNPLIMFSIKQCHFIKQNAETFIFYCVLEKSFWKIFIKQKSHLLFFLRLRPCWYLKGTQKSIKLVISFRRKTFSIIFMSLISTIYPFLQFHGWLRFGNLIKRKALIFYSNLGIALYVLQKYDRWFENKLKMY